MIFTTCAIARARQMDLLDFYHKVRLNHSAVVPLMNLCLAQEWAISKLSSGASHQSCSVVMAYSGCR
jgi:hypothetical protein